MNNNYINTINKPSPDIDENFKKIYKNTSDDGIKFNKRANMSKDSIKKFILRDDDNQDGNELLSDKFNDYINNTQKSKIFMLYKNNNFYIDKFDVNDL
jgi:hypothetical protein